MDDVREQAEQDELGRQSLAVCQQELARVRAAQETVLEDLAQERVLRREVEKQGDRLAAVVERLLLDPPPGRGPWARIRRRIRRARMARPSEWHDAALIARSDLFSPEWYIRRYPDILESGLPPALHYVRHGARERKNPSERFSTGRYLDAHPELRTSGVNPLVHHLMTDRARARDR